MLGLAHSTAAQQTCLVAPSNAVLAVNMYLWSGDDKRWRDSVGITAQRADDLPQLADSSDMALCRRMDSTLIWRPAYYFRAGRYIIGTNFQDSLASTNEFARVVFVFDSAGNRLHPTRGVTTPSNLHVVEALPGHVEVAWTNLSADVSSNRLQRAVGSGGFLPIGAAMSGSATSVIDTTPVAGNTYRYRIVAHRSGADSGYSNVAIVAVVNVGTVARTINGRLYGDDFNRADGDIGPDWTAVAGSAFRIAGNKAVPPAIPTSGGGDFMRLKDSLMTPSSSMCMQADMTSATGGGAPMIGTQISAGTNWSGWLLFLDSASGDILQLYSVLDLLGASAFASPAHAYSEGVVQATKLCTGNGFQKAWLNGQLKMSIASTVLNGVSGTVGIRDGGGFPSDGAWDNVVVMRSNSVSISGLGAGYAIRIGGLISSAATSSGIVTLDLQNVQSPSATIEIVNKYGVVVKKFTPTDGVWGGDTYSITGP